MEIYLQRLDWFPDPADPDVLADFTVVRSSDIGSGNGDEGEATDIKFRVCQEDLMPEVGIRLFPLMKLDSETQRVVSDIDALVVIPHETWAPINTSTKRTQFMGWLTLIVGRMYLTSQHSVSNDDIVGDAS